MITKNGWSGILIECQQGQFDTLVKNMSVFKITPICALVTDANFEKILESTELPKDFDLLSLDIDGEDYFLWDALKSYRPRVVVIEVFSAAPPEDWMVPERSAIPKMGDDHRGASISVTVELAKRKGYELALHVAGQRPPALAPCWGGGEMPYSCCGNWARNWTSTQITGGNFSTRAG